MLQTDRRGQSESANFLNDFEMKATPIPREALAPRAHQPWPAVTSPTTPPRPARHPPAHPYPARPLMLTPAPLLRCLPTPRNPPSALAQPSPQPAKQAALVSPPPTPTQQAMLPPPHPAHPHHPHSPYMLPVRTLRAPSACTSQAAPFRSCSWTTSSCDAAGQPARPQNAAPTRMPVSRPSRRSPPPHRLSRSPLSATLSTLSTSPLQRPAPATCSSPPPHPSLPPSAAAAAQNSHSSRTVTTAAPSWEPCTSDVRCSRRRRPHLRLGNVDVNDVVAVPATHPQATVRVIAGSHPASRGRVEARMMHACR